MASTGIVERKTSSGAVRFRAECFDKTTGRRVYKTFPTRREAVAWRRETYTALAKGTLHAATPTTVQQAWEAWLQDAEAGRARTRSGRPYKPSVVHGYRKLMETHVLPRLGRRQLTELRAGEVQRLVDDLTGAGLAAQTVRNVATALRVVLRRAVRHELVATNVVAGVHLPSGGRKRDRVADVPEMLRLVAALEDPRDRAAWALAAFAGLRRGELVALEWSSVDLLARTIRVERSYDAVSGTVVEPKSAAGTRTVGIPKLLLPFLTALDTTEGPVLAKDGRPLGATAMLKRCYATWKRAGLEPIGLHEARHTAASLLIASGANLKAVSVQLGHANIATTLDIYGHLLPGSVDEVTAAMDAYLERAGEA